MIVAALIQADQADVVLQLGRLVSTLTIIAVLIGLIGLGALVVSVVALVNVQRRINAINVAVVNLVPRIDLVLDSAIRIIGNSEDISAVAKVRINDILDTVDDANDRLRVGVIAIEQRVKEFGAVVDVVRDEAEELLLDAASTARGVHTVAALLRTGRQPPSARAYAADDDVFIEEE